MFCIYAPNLSRRFEYIAKFTLGEVLGLEFIIITNPKQNDGKIHLNYSNEQLDNCINLSPHAIINETGIQAQELDVFYHNHYPAFFQTQGDYEFDLFAASFYLLSRYEEYTDFKPDAHGRYSHFSSLAYKEKFLHVPLIDLWFKHFKSFLITRFSDLKFQPKPYRFVASYDIDIAFQNRSWYQTGGAILKHLLKGQFSKAGKRMSSKKDAFDVFDELATIHQQEEIKPIYFFLVAAKHKFNKNPSIKSKKYQSLIKKIFDSNAGLGLHPGYGTYNNLALLQSEKKSLEDIVGTQVINSRQHYIQFTLPDTYKLLLECGIKFEYSMGYGEVNGFRASTSHPFYWFDLTENKTSDLLVSPYCYMDSTDIFNRGAKAEKALEEILHYAVACKEHNGQFISIFHNHTLAENPSYFAMYADAIKRVKQV